jgi:hypothetical protein
MTAAGFADRIGPLRAVAIARAGALPPPTASRVPFVVVLSAKLAPPRETVPRLTLAGGGRPGFVDRHLDGDLDRFRPEVAVPEEDAYLVLDVERGEEFCGAVPEHAMATIRDRGRTPITVAEGIALVTQHPGTLAKNRCFSLGGSRAGDRRVPALWISERAPKLGWCWAGNPHSWLGMASCAGRMAAA